MEYVLQTPIRDEQIEKLRAGDIVHIKGMLFTARDEAHMHLLEHGLLAGFEPRGAALYHCGPVTRKTATGWEVVAAGEAEVGVALAEAVTAIDQMVCGEAADQREAIRRSLYETTKA